MKRTKRNSPNQSERQHGNGFQAVRLVICHTPEGGWDGTVSTLMNPKAQVSYHELIRKDGSEVCQFVPWGRKAWHAKVYNSMSDGISLEGFARRFDLDDKGTDVFAQEVAARLRARRLQPQWTTDPAKGGFCRHGDLQSDRTDPTPDLAEWKLFVKLVQHAYAEDDGEKPLPAWFKHWARWVLGGRKWRRPGSAPKRIPAWAWVKLAQIKRERRK